MIHAPHGDGLVLAVDVGGTTIKSELVAPSGDVVASSRVPTPHGRETLDAIGQAGDDLLTALPDDAYLSGAAVGVPGIVDRHAGVGVMSGNVGWRDLQIVAPLSDRWALPVLLDHDVTLGGWAEWRLGAGTGVDDLCFVSIGTGIAATLVVGGRLVRGGAGQAGELGHVPSRAGRLACGCGARGCLETIASATAIERAYAERSGATGVRAQEIVGLLATDPIARDVWHDAVGALADGLTHIAHAIGPRRVVIGGGLSGAGEELAVALRRALERRIRVVSVPEVVIGRFGARAGIVGVALLARTGSTENEV